MKSSYFFFGIIIITLLSCQKPVNNLSENQAQPVAVTIGAPKSSVGTSASFWLTNGDQSALLKKQTDLTFSSTSNRYSTITVDTTQTFQPIDGFGYTLTTGSAYVINHMATASRDSLLKEIFGSDSNSLHLAYIRLNIGASDMSPTVYSYDDLPAGQTDPNLVNFSLAPDQADLIPILKQIVALNPSIKILGTPWSPPTWMKSNNNSVGGTLLTQYYNTYANYLVKYLLGMKSNGINLDAITVQNEPLNPNNNPSMSMPATTEDSIIKLYLGPLLQTNNLATKIILYDHNCDHPEYPTSILGDASAYAYADGSAFHLYAGAITALTTVHNSYPNKNVYFTEQYTSSTGSFSGDLKWHLKNVIIGATTNWSRNALEWNLATDGNHGPYTPGGCTNCKGAFTISSTITRNVSYYIVGHASKYVPAGSVRIGSNLVGSLYNVAFKRPDGKKVLIVENDGSSSQTFNISFAGAWITPTLKAGSVATFVF